MAQAHESPYLAASAPIVAGLVGLASTALLSKFPTLSADETDIELVLDLLHLLRPAKAEIGVFDAILHMSRERWDDAIRVLNEVSERVPQFAHARALLAYSLSMKNDPSWQRYADEALELSPDPDLQNLVSAIRARVDLSVALANAQSTGYFVIPQSVAAITEQSTHNARAVAETPPPAVTVDSSPQMPEFIMHGFMRA